MPKRSNAAEALSYNSSEDLTLDQTVNDEAGLETVEIKNSADAITTTDDALRSEVSDALDIIDSLSPRIPEKSKINIEKQKGEIMKWLDKGNLEKAQKLATFAAEKLKNEVKTHEQLQSKIGEIKLRLDGRHPLLRPEITPTEADALQSLNKQMKEAESKGNFAKANTLADQIIKQFFNPNTNKEFSAQKILESSLLRCKRSINEALTRVPDWRSHPKLVKAIDQIDEYTDLGQLGYAGQLAEHVLKQINDTFPKNENTPNSFDRDNASFLSQAVTSKLENRDKSKIDLTPEQLKKIKQSQDKINKLIDQKYFSEASKSAQRLLNVVNKLLGLTEYIEPTDQSSRDTKINEPFNYKNTTTEQNLTNREESIWGLPDYIDPEMPTEQISNTKPTSGLKKTTADKFRDSDTDPVGMDFSNLSQNSEPKKLSKRPDQGQVLDLIDFPDHEAFDDEVVTTQNKFDNKATEKNPIPRRRSMEELSTDTERLNTIAPTVRQEGQEVQPPPIGTEIFEPEQVNEARHEEDEPDFDSITIPKEKGFFGKLRERFFGGNKKESGNNRDAWIKDIENMNTPQQVLEALKKFDIDITKSASTEEIKKLSAFLQETRGTTTKKPGEKAEIVRHLWNRYVELKKGTRDEKDSGLTQIDAEDVYDKKLMPEMDLKKMNIDAMQIDDVSEQLQKFGIDLNQEAQTSTSNRIHNLLNLDTKNGDAFKALYGRYVELINNNIDALKHSSSKDIAKFLKVEYGINTKKYLAGDKDETNRINLLRTENSQRRRLIDAAMRILENESMPNSPAERALRNKELVKMTKAPERIKTMAEILVVLKELYGIELNKNTGIVDNMDYFNALTDTYQKEAKKGNAASAKALHTIDGLIGQAEKILKDTKRKKISPMDTFIGRPDRLQEQSDRAA